MPKLEKALTFALIVSMLFSAVSLKRKRFTPADAPVILCESSMQQWWAVVFPTLQPLPEGEVELRLRIIELFKNASAR